MHWVMQHYGLKLRQCHLIRRGLNDNYAIRGLDGARYVARLYSIRPRGEFNVDFETALIEHLATREVDVAAPLRSWLARAMCGFNFRKEHAPWPCSTMRTV